MSNVYYKAKRAPIDCSSVRADKVYIGKRADADEVDVQSNAGLLCFTTPAPATISASGFGTDASVDLTAAEVLSGILSGDPAANTTTLVAPGAAAVLAALDEPKVGLSWDLVIINLATTAADEPMALSDSEGTVTLVGEGTVEAAAVSGEESSGSGIFRFRVTDIDATPAYSVYRIA